MIKKKLNIDNLNITKEDLTKLYKFSIYMFPIMYHDISQPLSTIVNLPQVALKILDKLKDRKFSSELEKLSEFLRLIAEAADAFSETFDMFFKQYQPLDINNNFVSKPMNIVNIIRSERKNIEINIGKKSLRSLELVFPENILFGILFELVNNAGKFIKQKGKILIRWKIEGSRFICEVHDNGPGIIKNLSHKFLPLEILSIKRGGLHIINRLISVSEGHLFFSKSKYLGGTLVYLDFPIIAYYKKGKLHECKKR